MHAPRATSDFHKNMWCYIECALFPSQSIGRHNVDIERRETHFLYFFINSQTQHATTTKCLDVAYSSAATLIMCKAIWHVSAHRRIWTRFTYRKSVQ